MVVCHWWNERSPLLNKAKQEVERRSTKSKYVQSPAEMSQVVGNEELLVWCVCFLRPCDISFLFSPSIVFHDETRVETVVCPLGRRGPEQDLCDCIDPPPPSSGAPRTSFLSFFLSVASSTAALFGIYFLLDLEHDKWVGGGHMDIFICIRSLLGPGRHFSF